MTEPGDTQSASGYPKSASNKAKRSFKNFLLQPLLQVKIGLYCIVLSVLFSVGVCLILYLNFAELVNSVVLMTDLEEDVRELFGEYWQSTQLWVYISFLVYLTLTVAISIIYTHKLIGPTIAFRRHLSSLAEGRYNARTYLRKGDAFDEVAEELNRLSEVLERKSTS